MEVLTARARRARWAVTAVFGINGMLIAGLAVRTPSLRLDLGLSAGQLGLGSAVFGVSAVAAMQVAGGLAAGFGSAPIVRLTVLLGPLGLLGVGIAGDFFQLALALLVLGTIHGTLDVAMNAHAVAVERTLRRHIMNSCHGAWSIGAGAGSLVALGLPTSTCPVRSTMCSSLPWPCRSRPSPGPLCCRRGRTARRSIGMSAPAAGSNGAPVGQGAC